MAISFISDLHLDKSRPHINKYFIEYLHNLDNSVTDLYILGDLFEYWVGDDDPMDGLGPGPSVRGFFCDMVDQFVAGFADDMWNGAVQVGVMTWSSGIVLS